MESKLSFFVLRLGLKLVLFWFSSVTDSQPRCHLVSGREEAYTILLPIRKPKLRSQTVSKAH